MSVALLVMTDGRDTDLAATVASAADALHGGPVTERWMFDDTGDPAHRDHLAATYPGFVVLGWGPRAGFGGAITGAWLHLCAHSAARFVFHLEGDFTFTRPVDLTAMAAVLDAHPELVQMALRRQAWSPAEHAAGGVIEQNPQAYQPHHDGAGNVWLAHRMFYTTNPGLYRATLCTVGWPAGAYSEGRFGHQLLAAGSPEASAAALRFGYWGARDDPPWVTHIGHQRTGNGY